MALGSRVFGVVSWSMLPWLAGCGGDDLVGATGGGGSASTTMGEPSPDGTGTDEPSFDATDTSAADGEGTTEHTSTGADATDTSTTDGEGTTTGHTSTGGEPACGNGIVEDGEGCDDAGESVLCNDDCTPAVCGDGHVNALAGEACDDMGESETCDADCSFAACGDGITNVTAAEECDDAGPSAGCDGDCSIAQCGDWTLNLLAGEQCDMLDLAGGTCQGLGFEWGTLGCNTECAYDTSACYLLPGVPVLQLGFSQVKRFDFSWAAVADAEHYELLESNAPGEPFAQLGGDIVGESISFEMPLHFRHEASYMLRACNGGGCTDSAVVDVASSLAEAVGYFKASNTGTGDNFGGSVALSSDGSTLAIGASSERSSAIGIDGDQTDDSAYGAGAVYVFVHDGNGAWSQQAYIKASNTDAGDSFGGRVQLSSDGNTLVVGARNEDSCAEGIASDPADNSCTSAGAAYVFVRDGMGEWSQQAYLKGWNPTGEGGYGSGESWFGPLGLSNDGDTLAVGAPGEDGAGEFAGAVYVFVRDGMGTWSQQAYVQASNAQDWDGFGSSVALASDGDTLAVGAPYERSNATGVGGNQYDNSLLNAGAVYVFVRDGAGTWSQQAYVKASDTGEEDQFSIVALSGDGDTLAVGAPEGNLSRGAIYMFERDGVGTWSQHAYLTASNAGSSDRFARPELSDDGSTLAVSAAQEDSSAIGIDGDQASSAAPNSGAVYVFVHDGVGAWSQVAYVKASNTGSSDRFSRAALSGDGDMLAVGAYEEDSEATGIGGDQANEGSFNAGAVYLY